MVELKNMLIAVDGSEIADYALNLGIKIAEKYSSKISLLHVVSGSRGASAAKSGPEKEYDMSEHNDPLLIERKKLVEHKHLSCDAISSRSNDIGGEIAKRSKDFDMVVTGSRGLSGIRSLILGSVSKKVAREAKCSVLIVKNKIDSLPKVLLAHDGSQESRKALEFVTDLAKKFKARVNVIGVVNLPISPEAYVVSDFDRWEREMQSSIQEAARSLKEQGIHSEAKLATFVDVSRAISEEVSKGEYDLVVLGNRGYGRLKSLFLGSVATGVADSAKTNVLIVKKI